MTCAPTWRPPPASRSGPGCRRAANARPPAASATRTARRRAHRARPLRSSCRRRRAPTWRTALSAPAARPRRRGPAPTLRGCVARKGVGHAEGHGPLLGPGVRFHAAAPQLSVPQQLGARRSPPLPCLCPNPAPPTSDTQVPLDAFCALMEEAIACRPRPRAYLAPSPPQKFMPEETFAPRIDARSKQIAAKLRPKVRRTQPSTPEPARADCRPGHGLPLSLPAWLHPPPSRCAAAASLLRPAPSPAPAPAARRLRPRPPAPPEHAAV
jgi:hypothetical protein